MQFERSLIIFLKGRYGSNRIVHDLKVFGVVKGYKPE